MKQKKEKNNCVSSKMDLSSMPKMTTEERAYQYELARKIINNARLEGKKINSQNNLQL